MKNVLTWNQNVNTQMSALPVEGVYCDLLDVLLYANKWILRWNHDNSNQFEVKTNNNLIWENSGLSVRI